MRRRSGPTFGNGISVRFSDAQIERLNHFCHVLDMDKSVLIRLVTECLIGADSKAFATDMALVPPGVQGWFSSMAKSSTLLNTGIGGETDPGYQDFNKIEHDGGPMPWGQEIPTYDNLPSKRKHK